MNKKKLTFIAISACLAIMMAGIMYSWTMFTTHIEHEFGWTRSQTSMTFTILISVSTIFAWWSAKLAKKFGLRKVVIAGAILGGFSLIISSTFMHRWQMYVYYGVLLGASIGVVYNCMLNCANQWFGKFSPTMAGVLLMFYVLGGNVLGLVGETLIKSYGWRTSFVILGCVYMTVITVASIFTVENPDAATTMVVAKNGGSGKNYTSKEMLKSSTFWCYFVWYIFMTAVSLTISNHIVQIVESIGYAHMVAVGFATVLIVINGVSRFSVGVLTNLKGKNIMILSMNIFAVIGSALLLLTMKCENVVLIYLALLFLGVSLGGIPVLNSIIIRHFFGNEYYGENIGIGNIAMIVSSLCGPYVAGLIYEHFGYGAVLEILIVLSVISIFISKGILREEAK